MILYICDFTPSAQRYGTNYGNDAIEIYFTNDVNFKADYNSNKGREIKDGTAKQVYWYAVQMKGNGSPTPKWQLAKGLQIVSYVSFLYYPP